MVTRPTGGTGKKHLTLILGGLWLLGGCGSGSSAPPAPPALSAASESLNFGLSELGTTSAQAEEQAYLAVAKQPLRDIATALVDGGFRPEELFRARWEYVHFQPAGDGQYGYIHNPFGKNKYAKRNISMTARVRALLEMRFEEQGKPSEGWVFPAAETKSGRVDRLKSGRVDRLKSQHAKALKDSGIKHFVIYSLRHTMLTRLGEAGADAFAIQEDRGALGHQDFRALRASDPREDRGRVHSARGIQRQEGSGTEGRAGARPGPIGGNESNNSMRRPGCPSGAAFFAGSPWAYYTFHYTCLRGRPKQVELWRTRMVTKPAWILEKKIGRGERI
jgi:hypothetical protein